MSPITPNLPANQYNVLFVLTDQERYLETIPSTLKRNGLQKLQERGVTFENHQINAVACSSSRSNLYTGQHIVQTGVFDNVNFAWQSDMSTKTKTMGHRLREAGYYAAYKGKWHLTKSFDRPYKEGDKSLSLEQYGFSDWHSIGDGIHHAHGGYEYDGMTVGSAIHWLRSQGQKCRDASQPWMLAVNLVNPHDIMFFNTDDDDEVTQGKQILRMFDLKKAPNHAKYQTKHDVPLPENRTQPLTEKGRPKAHSNFEETMEIVLGPMPKEEEERMKKYQDYYYNCIQDMDDNLNHLLEELDATGMAKNTIIIYTSDHGELGGAHGMRQKGSCAYREQLNVPLVIAHPAFEGGKRCKAITTHIDILPTILASNELPKDLKEKVYEDLPGHDLTQLLANPESAPFDAVRPGSLFTFNMLVMNLGPGYVREALGSLMNTRLPSAPKFDNFRGAIRSVYDGRYRFSRYFFPKQHNLPTTLEQILQYNDIELFDHETDPNENHNLAQDPEQYRQLIEEMNGKLNALIEAEIGTDKGQMLPFGKTLVNWHVKCEAMATI